MPPRSDRYAAFGRALRRLRVARGWSQEQLALEAGLDRTYMGGIERGERNPSLANVFKLADALGVPASCLHAEAERDDLT
jgi:transcriptional regulator with XRE-family HTH domain